MGTRDDKRDAPSLSPAVASRLLDLLSTDNAFRRLFKSDPLAALVRAGYDPAADKKHRPHGEDPVCCLKVDRIAPKQAIINARESLHEYLTSGLGMTPIQLNLGSTASRRLRK